MNEHELNTIKQLVLDNQLSPIFYHNQWFVGFPDSQIIMAHGSEMGISGKPKPFVYNRKSTDLLASMASTIAIEVFPGLIGQALSDRRAIKVLRVGHGRVVICALGITGVGSSVSLERVFDDKDGRPRWTKTTTEEPQVDDRQLQLFP